MDGDERKIEIFTPFGEAFELMKRILFQPFDLGKWFVIGFAAFLASLSGGIHFNFTTFNRHQDWHWRFSSMRHDLAPSMSDLPAWVIPLIIVCVLIALVIAVVLMWLGARGRFIFVDCIVRNRGAIQEPWREFRREGNSFFLFSLLIALLFLIIALVMVTPMLLPLLLHGPNLLSRTTMIVWLVCFVTVILLIAFGWHGVSQLMVPVMYRKRCRAAAAFSEVIRLILDHPGPLILYFLFFVVLVIAFVVLGCTAACVTCCLAAIPYVGTVILLPLHVLLYGFTLFFLRQFGNDFDVWGGSAPLATPAPPPLPSLPA